MKGFVCIKIHLVIETCNILAWFILGFDKCW
jgi:hypothetical protein